MKTLIKTVAFLILIFVLLDIVSGGTLSIAWQTTRYEPPVTFTTPRRSLFNQDMAGQGGAVQSQPAGDVGKPWNKVDDLPVAAGKPKDGAPVSADDQLKKDSDGGRVGRNRSG